MKQGQSPVTIAKEAEIQSLVRFILAAIKPKQYFVFDLNCGSGRNDENGCNCLGTGPLAARSMRKYGVDGHVWLCDKNRKHLEAARLRYSQRSLFEPGDFVSGISATFIHCDNRDFALTIPQLISDRGVDPKNTNGIIICDPNGLEVPLDQIAFALSKAPRLDVAIHLGAALQVWSYWNTHPDNSRCSYKSDSGKVRSFDHIFSVVPKKTWLVSEFFRNGGRDHNIIFGSNLRNVPPLLDKPGRPNMYLSNSAEGQAIIRSASARSVA